VSTEGELDSVFASLVQLGVGALLVAQEPSYFRWREQIIALAARHAIPATYGQREYPAAGGLMSYDASVADSFRQVGLYVGRILKGEKPADLPTATRGADALPGSKATSRAKGSYRNLGGLASGRRCRVMCVEYGGPHREGEEP
jgi:putative tryptophan/tyrosine transport system substrate-binding protein